jgi:hypothetical protein
MLLADQTHGFRAEKLLHIKSTGSHPGLPVKSIQLMNNINSGTNFNPLID